MKNLLLITLTLTIGLLLGCNDPTVPNEMNITKFEEGDTLFVARDSSETFRVSITSSPGLSSESIFPQVYENNIKVSPLLISSQVADYSGYQTNPTATIVVSATTLSSIGEYELRVVSTNGSLSDSIMYVLIVR